MGLFSSSSRSGHPSTNGGNGTASGQSAHVLQLNPSPTDPGATVVDCAGHPLFVIRRTSRKELLVYRIGTGTTSIQPTIIGSVTTSELSGSAELTLHGQPMKLKCNYMSLYDEYSFTYPPVGKFKWKLDSLLGTGLNLVDANGQKLVRYVRGTSGRPDGKRMELLVPCDDMFLDMVVVTGRAAGALQSNWEDEASEIVGQIMN